MKQENNHPPVDAFGFMTVIEVPSLGHCGGLLVVSRIGRPLEFHCTAPVGPNRAQEIMYGATYKEFLYSEQIGMALVHKTKTKPGLFLADCGDLLPISKLIDIPIILVEEKNAADPISGRGLENFTVKNQRICFVDSSLKQREWIRSSAELFARSVPLEEPFERIRQAIEEAHKVIRAA